MAQAAPSSLDGGSLSAKQRERLQVMIDAVAKSDPSRSKEYVLNQAVKSFVKTAFLSRGRWTDRQKFNLNNGEGPVVVPSWSRLVDVQ